MGMTQGLTPWSSCPCHPCYSPSAATGSEWFARVKNNVLLLAAAWINCVDKIRKALSMDFLGFKKGFRSMCKR